MSGEIMNETGNAETAGTVEIAATKGEPNGEFSTRGSYVTGAEFDRDTNYIEDRLSTRRFLLGGTITEADLRLFTTLARFDPIYHRHFKANRNKLSEMEHLWGYARELFQTPGFSDTIDFVQIKQHYYGERIIVGHSPLYPAA